MTLTHSDVQANPTINPEIIEWVVRTAGLTRPDRIVWCDGSTGEFADLTEELVESGTLIRLNPELRPNSFLARSDPDDVARVESRTFICCADPEDAGPTNNWRDPVLMRSELDAALTGSMRGRTMYVVPFAMGPIGGPITQYGVQLTDSAYVVASMALMTRMGAAALHQLSPGRPWVKALHSVGRPLLDEADDVPWPCNRTKYISHFPQSREIISFGSGYGGNALLGKKCFALRIASAMGRDEGWMAEHMLLIQATNPAGRTFTLTGAFPSATGKTNLAMLQPTLPGWSVSTVGDDIVWMRPDDQGQLRAINPENGFFGVAPGTGWATNPVAMATLTHDVIFTNVALTDDGDVWWEGMTEQAPDHLIDWLGADWTPDSPTPAAHPNSRFTVRAEQCPTISPHWDDPEGVVVDAIIVGGRRASNVPLVAQAESWEHGCYLGATLASEQTAAAEGPVGVLRHDPFAMQPFTGYHMADYWQHWLDMGARLGDAAPKIFAVNWFRKGADGSYLWPGFGENVRALDWITRRVEGSADAVQTPIGLLPPAADLDLSGLDLTDEVVEELLAIDADSWLAETADTVNYFESIGPKVPRILLERLELLRARLREASALGG